MEDPLPLSKVVQAGGRQVGYVQFNTYEIDNGQDRLIDTLSALQRQGMVKAAKLQKGSGEPNKKKVGKVSMAQIEEIAKLKMPDLSAYDLGAACKTIIGTARSMGIDVE